MGTGGQDNANVGPEYRSTVGEKWGLRVAVDHPFIDLSEARTLELIDEATANQTTGGWRGQMNTAEQDWWDDRTSSEQVAILGAAKAARAAGWYS